MTNLNDLLQELGISKVKLAKYLGVSRQMIYNYLELENLNKWPKEKKLLLFKLLNQGILTLMLLSPQYCHQNFQGHWQLQLHPL